MKHITIAVTNSKTQKKYKNQKLTVEAFEARNRNPIRTTETWQEFAKMPKSKREEIKDVGGYFPGELKDGSRKAANVNHLSVFVFDADKIPAEVDFPKAVFTALKGVKCSLHTTHSHNPDNQRYRVFVWLSRNAKPDESPPAMRKIAENIGMDYFDPCSFEVNRMMYWASCSANADFDYQSQAGDFLDVDEWLGKYTDWKDVTQWSVAKTESEAVRRGLDSQEDPLLKSGVVGAFCRVYSIVDAMNTHLQGVYENTTIPDRYTYTRGESHGGFVVYDGGKFCFSHHATDPASGKMLNAFDLVRVHKFGSSDEKKSFESMREFAMSLPQVKVLIAKERQAEAASVFETLDDDKSDWRSKLKYKKKSDVLENSVYNALLIFNNDPDLANFAFNELAGRVQVTGKMPWKRPPDNKFWRDADTAQLKAVIDRRYAEFTTRNHDVAFVKTADDRRFHPIRDYLDGLPPWDGIPRIELLLIRCLRADDTPYVRAVTRKTFAAAVARIYKPGTKFDSVLVFDGEQGIGKSTLFKDLVGEEFYSETLSLTDMDDKAGAEKLQGFWVVEIGELAGMKKADIEKVKAFITTSDDKFRPSYGRTVESHPRQCVIIGSVNGERGYLRDITGNRRFWIVKCNQEEQTKSWDFTDEERSQIWAEAKALWQSGEKLYLEGDLIGEAQAAQRDAMEVDERQGMVERYLNILLPSDWESRSIQARRNYINDGEWADGVNRRQTVSNAEIWCEAFGRNLSELKPADSYALAALMMKVDGWKRTKSRVVVPAYGRQRIYEWDGTTITCPEVVPEVVPDDDVIF